jgi:hypothetical protein
MDPGFPPPRFLVAPLLGMTGSMANWYETPICRYPLQRRIARSVHEVCGDAAIRPRLNHGTSSPWPASG